MAAKCSYRNVCDLGLPPATGAKIVPANSCRVPADVDKCDEDAYKAYVESLNA